MIRAFARDAAFLASLAEPPRTDDELRVWWLGQSGFLLQCGGRRILLDPYLSDSLTKKYAATDKPHVRMTERVIAPERLTGIDAVTCSHNHTDHLDAETIVPLRRWNPTFTFYYPEANRDFVRERLGTAMEPAHGLTDRRDDWIPSATCTSRGFSIRAIASAHNEIERDEHGCPRYVGYLLKLGRWTIYHSGDTLFYPELPGEIRTAASLMNSSSAGHIDLALLPINGNKPERRVAGNLDGREAAELAHDVGARLVVPCHYEMFEFNSADPRELFVPACVRLGQPYRLLKAGESLVLA